MTGYFPISKFGSVLFPGLSLKWAVALIREAELSCSLSLDHRYQTALDHLILRRAQLSMGGIGLPPSILPSQTSPEIQQESPDATNHTPASLSNQDPIKAHIRIANDDNCTPEELPREAPSTAPVRFRFWSDMKGISQKKGNQDVPSSLLEISEPRAWLPPSVLRTKDKTPLGDGRETAGESSGDGRPIGHGKAKVCKDESGWCSWDES